MHKIHPAYAHKFDSVVNLSEEKLILKYYYTDAFHFLDASLPRNCLGLSQIDTWWVSSWIYVVKPELV